MIPTYHIDQGLLIKMENKKKRNNLIDIMKGLLILDVAVYHLIYRVKGSMFDNIVREIGYLAIPMFFCLAGYFYRDITGSLISGIWTRIKKILLPVLGVSGVLLLLFGPYYMLVHHYTAHDWLGDILMTYLRPELMAIILPEFSGGQLFNNISPVWFIWTLLFSTLLFLLCMEFAKKNNARLIITTIVLLAIGIVMYVLIPAFSWCLQMTPFYAGIMMLGVILNRFTVFEKLEKINLGISSVIMIAAAIAHYFIFMNFGSDLMYLSIVGDKGFLSGIAFVIQIIVGGYALFTFSRIIALWKYSEEAFAWVGRHTLVILLFHCLIGGIAADIMHTYNKPGPDWYVDPLTAETVIKSIISFIAAIAGSCGLAALNDKLKARKKSNK